MILQSLVVVEVKILRIEKKTTFYKSQNRSFSKKIYISECIDCKKEIKLSKHEIDKNLRTNKCRSCSRSDKTKPFKRAYSRLKNTYKSMLLTYEEYLDFTKILNCAYCSTDIAWAPHGLNCYRSNLDRKNPKGDYSKSNCVVCCWECNRMKSNKLTYEEFLLLSPGLKEIRKKRQNG